MIGGSPIFAQPNFATRQGPNFGLAFPAGAAPAQQRTGSALQKQQPTNVAANPQPRIARGKIDDPPLPVRSRIKEKQADLVSLPSPEELGIVTAKVADPKDDSFDWSQVQSRFRKAGASCFHVDFLPEGGCKVACVLPTSQPNCNHRIDAQGGSEEEVARSALAKLEEWQSSQEK
jgi:hypothetical protein